MVYPMAFVVLGDGVRGQYAWQHAIGLHKDNLRMFVSDAESVSLADWLEAHPDCLGGDTLDAALSPDNDNFDTHVETLTYHNAMLFCMNGRSDDLWQLEMLDGDVIAVNPAAVWDEREEIYRMQAAA